MGYSRACAIRYISVLLKFSDKYICGHHGTRVVETIVQRSQCDTCLDVSDCIYETVMSLSPPGLSIVDIHAHRL